VRKILAVAWAPWISVACTGEEPAAGDTAEPADSGSADSGEPQDTAAAVRPVVESAEVVRCYNNSDGEDEWNLAATVSDPQGVDDISHGRVEVLEGDDELYETLLACRGADCTASWGASGNGIDCDYQGRVTLRFYAIDKSGNESLPLEIGT
jgi:hypothetical protein